MNAVIGLSRCSQTKQMYGIRFEREGKDWKYTWAFSISEKSATREQYDKTRITGDLSRGPEFPGCPHCGAVGFFHCECGKLNCWNGESLTAECKWCGSRGILEDGVDSLDITGNV